METFDFDRHLRRIELASSGAEFVQLEQELANYLFADEVHEEERNQAFSAAINRQMERSAIELATFRELMGKPTPV